MANPLPAPQDSAEGVRTPVVASSRLCQVCQVQKLQGEQKACSAACRRRRSRQRDVEARAIREREVLTLLEHAGSRSAPPRSGPGPATTLEQGQDRGTV